MTDEKGIKIGIIKSVKKYEEFSEYTADITNNLLDNRTLGFLLNRGVATIKDGSLMIKKRE